MAEIGSEHRQMPLNILAGTVEALKGPDGESVSKIMDSWTALPNRASQTDPASQLPERTSEVPQAQSCAELRNKKTVIFRLWEDSTAQCGIVLQRIASRRMQWDQTRLSELGLTNMEDTVDKIHVLAVQCKTFADPQTGDSQ
jgi:hypothetical protein